MAFTHPWFLLGLLGIGIPIAIHLFELRRPQRILFSNVEFIREIKLVTARQRKLKHLAVLLTRISFISALTLLFAQPFIPAPDAGVAAGNAVSVLLDNSPSMRQLGANEQPVLEQAITEARDLPLAFPLSAQFQLVPEHRRAQRAAEYRATLEETAVSGQATDLGQRINQTQFARGKGPLFVFSDFQKNSFSPRVLSELDSTQQTFLVPLAGEPAANVFVDSVWLDDAFVRLNTDILLHIRLRNGGRKASKNCPVNVFVGNRQVSVFRADIPAQQTITTQVGVRLTDSGVQLCRIQVDDFPVDFDNTYYFTLQPATQIQVVEVGVDSQLRQVYGNEPLFGYNFVDVRAIDYQKISKGNLLFIREALPLSANLRSSLRQAVQQGATVVVVPPPSPAGRTAYSELLREIGVGPVQWTPPAAAGPVLEEVAQPSTQNPFFREVFVGLNQRAGMPKVAPVLRWARSGTEVLKMRDGDSYLAGFRSGLGMAYVFAAPFSAPYSNFAQHPLFVPVLYRLAMQSYQQEQQPAYRLNQAVVSLRLPAGPRQPRGEAVYQLVQDSLTYIPAQRRQGNVLQLDVPPTLRQPGFYTLTRAGTPTATLAFNFDKRESDLRSYSAEELRQLTKATYPNVHVYEAKQGQTVAAQYKATRVGTPLWHYCLWAALGCLLLESLLLRSSRPRAPRQVAAAA